MDVECLRVPNESRLLLLVRGQHWVDRVEPLLDQRAELVLDNVHDLRLAALQRSLELGRVLALLLLLVLGDLGASSHVRACRLV